VNTALGPFKGMSLFIFGLGSVVFNLCLTNSVHVLYKSRRYITEERDRVQRVRALTAAQIQWGQLIFNMSVDNLWLPLSHQFSLSGWQNFKIMIPTTCSLRTIANKFIGRKFTTKLKPSNIFLSLRPICHKIWLFLARALVLARKKSLSDCLWQI
jgi:hypothetical protein